ncbi:MAG: magnesium/cobalt transporter CorA [Nitrospiraceae bacterium]|nr:MAG: magnesium/cobalt transporter CorA [Nitrospiraceae bacterium]
MIAFKRASHIISDKEKIMVQYINKVSKKAGLPPGSPVYVGDKKIEKVGISVMSYDEENLEIRELEKVEECFPFKEKPPVTWINVDGLHEITVIQELGSCFGWHPLIIEDILNTHQRTKIDIFDDHLFISLKMLTFNAKENKLNVEQMSIVLGENYVITFQERQGDIFDSLRNRIKSSKGKVRKVGADYLAYALIDSVVDNYFIVLEGIGEVIENMEEELVIHPSPGILQQIHTLKREMIYLRKSVWPLREIIALLEREETSLIKESTSIYIRDLYDHTIQVIETLETYRDMVSGMLDVYLSSISNRMNEVMKVLTIFAAVFIPLTLIAGIYGMNFNPEKSPFNMPELNWYMGYPFALGLMVLVAAGLLYYFRKRKWF